MLLWWALQVFCNRNYFCRMGEWMSVLETRSPIVAKMIIRKNRILQYNMTRPSKIELCSEIVQCMDGDIANLDDIEDIDFDVPNMDLIRYIHGTFWKRQELTNRSRWIQNNVHAIIAEELHINGRSRWMRYVYHAGCVAFELSMVKVQMSTWVK